MSNQLLPNRERVGISLVTSLQELLQSGKAGTCNIVGRERRSLAALCIPGRHQPRGCRVSLWLHCQLWGFQSRCLAKTKKCALLLP